MLGSNEDAAQKRVARAVEKIARPFLCPPGHGCFCGRDYIGPLRPHHLAAAPAGLASSVSTRFAGRALDSGNLFTTLKILLARKTTRHDPDGGNCR